jgi:hypothetical protein
MNNSFLNEAIRTLLVISDKIHDNKRNRLPIIIGLSVAAIVAVYLIW